MVIIQKKSKRVLRRFLAFVLTLCLCAANSAVILAADKMTTQNNASDEVYATFVQGEAESWGYTKYEMTIHNNASQSVCNWEIRIALPYSFGWQDSWGWCADFSMQDNCLVIDPKDGSDMGTAIAAYQTYDSAGFYLPTGMTMGAVTVSYEYGNQSTDNSGSTTVGDVTLSGETVDLAFKDTPVGKHGELSVNGIHLVDKNGKNFQLRGVSTHGINWFPEYVNKTGFQNLRDEWGVNAIRLAMYTIEYNGYCAGGDQNSLKNLVKEGVSYATDLGMYVIVDWHILNDRTPATHMESAKDYFAEMSALYKNYDNVIYEICNEPNGGTSWEEVKAYAEVIIPIIKANNPDAVIIVGTPNWCQDVDIAADNPITGYSNIMYAVHFYSDTHRDTHRNKLVTALNKGLPVLCSEYGVCDASGDGGLNLSQANVWLDLLDEYEMSYFCWALTNKAETASLLKSSCSRTSGYLASDLSDAGKWLVSEYNARNSSGKRSTEDGVYVQYKADQNNKYTIRVIYEIDQTEIDKYSSIGVDISKGEQGGAAMERLAGNTVFKSFKAEDEIITADGKVFVIAEITDVPGDAALVVRPVAVEGGIQSGYLGDSYTITMADIIQK